MLTMIEAFIVVGTSGDSNNACKLLTMSFRRFARLDARQRPLDLSCAVSEGSWTGLPPVVLWNPPWLRGMHYIKKEITYYWQFPKLLLRIQPQESESTHTMAQWSILNPILWSCRMCVANLSLSARLSSVSWFSSSCVRGGNCRFWRKATRFAQSMLAMVKRWRVEERFRGGVKWWNGEDQGSLYSFFFFLQ